MKRKTSQMGNQIATALVLALISACGLKPTAVEVVAPSSGINTAEVEPILPQTEPGPEETVRVLDPGTGPSIYSGGTDQTLMMPGCFDLDQGEVSGPPDPGCDLHLVPGSGMVSIDLYPVNRAQLGGRLPKVPLHSECSTAGDFGGEMLRLDPRSDQSYLCFETGAGRTGWIRFTGADLGATRSVTFEWQTFAKEAVANDGSPGTLGQVDTNLTYSHKGFGFQLTLPPSWSGYRVTEFPHQVPHSICFSFPQSSPICVLQIDVFTQDSWQGLQKVHPDYYLAENDGFVFAAGPFTPECIQMDEFQCARSHEIPDILASFTFN